MIRQTKPVKTAPEHDEIMRELLDPRSEEPSAKAVAGEERGQVWTVDAATASIGRSFHAIADAFRMEESYIREDVLKILKARISKITEIISLTNEDIHKIAMPVYNEFIAANNYRAAATVAVFANFEPHYVTDPAEQAIKGYLQRGDYVGAVEVTIEAGLPKERTEALAREGFNKYIANASVLAENSRQIQELREELGSLLHYRAMFNLEKELYPEDFKRWEKTAKDLTTAKRMTLHELRKAERTATLGLALPEITKAFKLVKLCLGDEFYRIVKETSGYRI